MLVKLQFEPAPLLLGFVLGPMIEEYFRRAMIISRGDPMVFLQKPISGVMLGIAAVLLVIDAGSSQSPRSAKRSSSKKKK